MSQILKQWTIAQMMNNFDHFAKIASMINNNQETKEKSDNISEPYKFE